NVGDQYMVLRMLPGMKWLNVKGGCSRPSGSCSSKSHACEANQAFISHPVSATGTVSLLGFLLPLIYFWDRGRLSVICRKNLPLHSTV
ncbi:hypothetical protein ACH5RR_001614, partial [Cinchona calisaya]